MKYHSCVRKYHLQQLSLCAHSISPKREKMISLLQIGVTNKKGQLINRKFVMLRRITCGYKGQSSRALSYSCFLVSLSHHRLLLSPPAPHQPLRFPASLHSP